MIDKKYTLLSKEVSRTDALRKKALAVLKKAKGECHEAKKGLYDAKGEKNLAIEEFTKVMDSRKQDDEKRLALARLEEYLHEQEMVIAGLDGQYKAVISQIKAIKAKAAKCDRKRDFPSWKRLMLEISELEGKADELYSVIGELRLKVGEEKLRIEAEILGDDLEYREARVNLDEAKLELSRKSRIYAEKVQAYKSAVAAYEKACKNHNAAVTELWLHMINKRKANMAM